MTKDNILRFSFTFSLDKDEFFRRTCPNCGRDFKTKADAADMSSILQPAFRRIESEIDGITLSTSDADQSPQYLSCPYCNHRAESGDMLTEGFLEYLRRFVIREYVLPSIHRMFSDFSGGLKRSNRPTGFFRIEMKFDFDSTLPPRPLSGPEAPDMMRIDLLCCGKSIKVHDGYFELNKCPYCGEAVILS
jgi:hypothetical protein